MDEGVHAHLPAQRRQQPGAASFVKSPDNTETWVVYHANSSAGQGCGTTRTTRAQKISFNSDGSPNLGVPVRTGTTIEGPSGDSNASSPTVYRINVRHSGKAMDVQQPNTDNGARVGQYTCGSGTDQQFQMVANGGYLQLRARHEHRHQPALVTHGHLTIVPT
ncbi:RICIN domain-containing protein [Nonomuraea mesophila]|uniref:RICIN domain-containing protein n=1 Tax=Nonomuraea mesophila TaxID=2530382 RepID=UPI00140E483C|nr:RICIN domain-containing protein [Nonomuraea mesophila]